MHVVHGTCTMNLLHVCVLLVAYSCWWRLWEELQLWIWLFSSVLSWSFAAWLPSISTHLLQGLIYTQNGWNSSSQPYKTPFFLFSWDMQVCIAVWSVYIHMQCIKEKGTCVHNCLQCICICAVQFMQYAICSLYNCSEFTRQGLWFHLPEVQSKQSCSSTL